MVLGKHSLNATSTTLNSRQGLSIEAMHAHNAIASCSIPNLIWMILLTIAAIFLCKMSA